MALYKRKTYLIDKKFQLKFSIYFVLIVTLSNVFYLFTISDIYEEFSKILLNNYPSTANSYSEKKSALFSILALWQLAVSCVLFIVGIFLSHKIAGPIYKTKLFFKKYRSGESQSILSFRDGDYFNELAQEYNKTIQYINTTQKTVHEEVDLAINYLQQGEYDKAKSTLHNLANITSGNND